MSVREPWFEALDPPSLVAVRTADDRWLRKLAVGIGGRDFPCTYAVWEDEPDADPVPWPIEDVRPLNEVPDALSRAAYSQAKAAE